MRSKTEIETETPKQLKEILEPSLDSGDKVEYNITTEKDRIVVKVETEKLGTLRACTDNVFRLTMLATKI